MVSGMMQQEEAIHFCSSWYILTLQGEITWRHIFMSFETAVNSVAILQDRRIGNAYHKKNKQMLCVSLGIMIAGPDT